MKKTIKLKHVVKYVTGSIYIVQKNEQGKLVELYRGGVNGFEYWMRNFPVLRISKHECVEGQETPDDCFVIEVGDGPTLNPFAKCFCQGVNHATD
jgi:hypothetical protein